MKSALFFISLLAFAYCLTPLKNDNQFIELKSQPEAQAVFLTMSMKMKTGEGFSEILGLLTQLVDEAQEQRAVNTETFAGVKVGCQLSQYEATAANEYYEGNIKVTEDWLRYSTEEAATVDNLITERRSQATKFGSLYTKCQDNRAKFAGYLSDVRDKISAGIELAKSIEKELETPVLESSVNLLQKKLDKLTQSYLVAKGYHVRVPTVLLQRAVDQKIVGERLKQWVFDIRVSMIQGLNNFDVSKFADGGEVEKMCKVAEVLGTDLNESASKFVLSKTHLNVMAGSTQTLLDGLTKTMGDNLAAKKDGETWCTIEEDNFNLADASAVKTTDVFKSVREYFIHHYNDLNDFVKQEYH
jgi:hypothetical protein